MIWYVYLLTSIGLTPGGSSTVHIYTQTVYRTSQCNRMHRILHLCTYQLEYLSMTIKIHKHN
jgi:hypothetical protein